MTELVVMTKGFDRMNVPTSKLQKFLDEGWLEVERVEMTSDTSPAQKPKSDASEAKNKTPRQRGRNSSKAAAKGPETPPGK